MKTNLEKDFFRKIVSDKRLKTFCGLSVKPSELIRSNLGLKNSECFDYSVEHRLITDIYLKTKYFKESKKIFLYNSTNVEMNTMPIRQAAFDLGKRVFMPKVIGEKSVNGKMEFIEVFPDTKYESHHGLLEPVEEAYFNPNDTENVIELLIPGICFDLHGNRLGYGCAFYDRYIQRFRREKFHISALAYDYQLFSSLPSSEFDIPVDLIITNKDYIDLLLQ